MTQTPQYEQKNYKEADIDQIEVTFTSNSRPGGKSLGYGRIITNGVSFFYNVYPSPTSALGIFVALPSKQKPDGTYDNQVVILGADNRAIYDDLVLQEMSKQGVRVTPGTPTYAPKTAPAATTPATGDTTKK